MPRWQHGLVIGKFLPPHRGHKHLIDTARSQVDRLTVMICDKPEYGLDGNIRAAWLKEIHPDCEIVLIHDEIDDDDSFLWAENTKKVLGKSPDVVFTSEDYGEPYTKFLECDHVLVDRQRLIVPCSGTMVREDALNHLDFLEPCVRAHYVKRICVLGAESTGTTTMAEALASHYQTTWVPEYGREYWTGKMDRGEELVNWDESEFIHIAQEQCRREDQAARTANKVLFCDTDAFATSVWVERYMNRRSTAVEEIGRRPYAITFLTGDEIPFEQDGFRDGEHIRHWMHERFVERLREAQRPFVLLTGDHPRRLAQAIQEVDPLLRTKQTTNIPSLR